MVAKILTALALFFLAIVVLLSLTAALAASAAGAANSIAVGKLADALQMSQLLTACLSLLALVGGIGLGASGLSAFLALRRGRRQMKQTPGSTVPYAYVRPLPSGDTEFLPGAGLPRPHSGIFLLDELPTDPDAGDNLFQNWLE